MSVFAGNTAPASFAVDPPGGNIHCGRESAQLPLHQQDFPGLSITRPLCGIINFIMFHAGEEKRRMGRKLRFGEYATIASMLFGLFFGAGNLIFPVYMGQLAGRNIWQAVTGFLITGVGMPLLGVMALGVSRCSGLAELSGRVEKRCGWARSAQSNPRLPMRLGRSSPAFSRGIIRWTRWRASPLG